MWKFKGRTQEQAQRGQGNFSCTDPDDMNYEVLAKKARYFKRDEKGVADYVPALSLDELKQLETEIMQMA